MLEATLENPSDLFPLISKDFRPLKCSTRGCNSKSFSLYLPKKLDTYYNGFQADQEMVFKAPIEPGEYYGHVQLTCAKCGSEVEDMTLFMSLGDWKPSKERKTRKKND